MTSHTALSSRPPSPVAQDSVEPTPPLQYLLLLPTQLLLLLWPLTRTVMGIRTCKGLRKELLQHNTVLFQASNMPNHLRRRGTLAANNKTAYSLCGDAGGDWSSLRATFEQFSSHSIHLRWNGIGTQWTQEIVTAMQITAVGPRLLSLTLSGGLDDACGPRLTDFLSTATSLTLLDLGERHRFPAGRQRSWWSTDTIQHKLYRDTRFSSDITTHIVRTMFRTLNLTSLNLRRHDIGPRGARQLARCLRRWHSLYTLQLSGTHLTNEGLALLCKEWSSTLTTLDLSDTHLDEECIPSLHTNLH